jgi:hypothetical protein
MSYFGSRLLAITAIFNMTVGNRPDCGLIWAVLAVAEAIIETDTRSAAGGKKAC